LPFVGKGDPLRGELEDVREEAPRGERGPRRQTGASDGASDGAMGAPTRSSRRG
jgi:hypothetical protein